MIVSHDLIMDDTMSNRTINLTDTLYQYLLDHSVSDNDIKQQLRAETAKLDMAIMQIAPDQGQFMSLLVKITGARNAIEIGVFTGYSALCIAEALPENGQLIACDVSEEWTKIGRQYWEKAGIAHKIKLKLAPARTTLQHLLDDGLANTFDFVFIDADKINYDHYYEQSLQLLRPGGLIAIDNTLWGGSVADANIKDVDTQAIRQLNDKLPGDLRVDISMLPIGDGLTLVRKKG